MGWGHPSIRAFAFEITRSHTQEASLIIIPPDIRGDEATLYLAKLSEITHSTDKRGRANIGAINISRGQFEFEFEHAGSRSDRGSV